MSEPKLISPLLDGFLMGDPISSHHGVRCCPAMRKDTEEKYIVKVISIPASQVQLDALLLTGAYRNLDGARTYFKELSEGVEDEAETLKHLSSLEGFDAYEGWQVVPMEDGTGYDVYLLSPYKVSLERLFRHKPMTHLAAVNLGLDMCAALAVCRRAGYLYVDLKPDNIFVTDDQVYHIGDLGFMKRSGLKYASLPDKYRSAWTPPEIEDAFASLNETMDIYALGLILYQAYNNGQLPAQDGEEGLPAPMYADYEMAEIILKACAEDPKDRWQDPLQMGQALVSYMQRNTVNDDPIVPPPVPVEVPEEEAAEEIPEDADEAPAEAAEVSDEAAADAPAEDAAAAETEVMPEAEAAETSSEEEIAEDGQLSIDDILADTQSILDEPDVVLAAADEEDETVPSEEMAQEMTEEGLSEEVTEMLAQADELIAHEAPAPVVAPEPIEIPMPEPIPIEKDEPNPEEPAEDTDTEDGSETDPTPRANHQKAPKKKRSLLIPILVILTALLLIASGTMFYQHYYLQEISQLAFESERNELTVRLTTDIDESKLKVVVTDTYGNVKREAVSGGAASFTDLTPGTNYKISVEISGFHKLTGDVSAMFTTDQQTKIVTFTAITGNEDGSAILNFTVDGPETQEWTVAYSAPGEAEKQQSFTGHMVTVTGLTVGSEYTFRLIPGSDLYVTGESELTYTASKVILAEKLTITEYDFESFTVNWSIPEDAAVESWIVRCYNENGYDKTVTVSEPSASFDGIDSTVAYTIEVTAAGMAQSARMYVSADPVNITSVKSDTGTAGSISLEWTYEGDAPEGGWLLLYSIDGSEMQSVVKCEEAKGTITNAVPNSDYFISIQAADGTGVFGGTCELTTPEAPTFNSFKLKNTDLVFKMCKTPAVEKWDRYDLDDSDYTTTFSVGEKASFLVKAQRNYSYDKKDVTVLFVIRDSEGKFVSANTLVDNWYTMIKKYYCELDIPSMPTAAGEYSIEVYFNNAYVTTQTFTIQ